MRTSNRSYPLSVIILLALALLLASQPAASVAWLPSSLDLLSQALDHPPHLSLPFLAGGSGLMALIAIFVYARALNPYAERRPLGWVWLNGFAPCLFAAIGLTCNVQAGVESSLPVNPAIIWGGALGLPTLLLLVEQGVYGVFLKIGKSARLRGWRRMALRAYNASLRLRPARPELLKFCGLLHRQEDDCPQAIALLERLGPVEQCEDEKVLRALEQCYRTEGYLKDALVCLTRLRALRLDTPGLDRKILDDQIKLGLFQEALELIQEGRLKQNFALLMVRQSLHVKVGQIAEAMEVTRQIEAQEPAPKSHAERLYRELVSLWPEEQGPRIALGTMLLGDADSARRGDGAEILEEAVKNAPERSDLRRRLYDYYRETPDDKMAQSRARRHLETLAQAEPPEAALALELARHYANESRLKEAEGLTRRVIDAEPSNWRARLQLGWVLFEQDRLDEAAEALGAAEAAAPADAEANLNHLRNDMNIRRRELRLGELKSNAGAPPKSNGNGTASEEQKAYTQQQFEYLHELLGLERVDQALKLAEEMLTAHPELRGEIEGRLLNAADDIESNFRLLDYLADMSLEDGKFDGALRLYRRMAERSLQPGQALREGCEKILARAPEHLEARMELAMACRLQNDWHGVLDIMEPVIARDGVEIEPADKALWVEAAFREGRVNEAIETGLPLAETLAGEPGYMLLLIDALQSAERHQDAYDIYQKAHEAAPDDPRLARLARRIASNRRTQRLGQLNKQQATGELTPLEHYEKAELHREMGQIGDAIVHYQRAADEEDLAVLALAKMAVSLCEKGMYDLAEEIISPLQLTREIDVRHPELKELFYSVARTLEKIKRPDLAMKYYKRIFHVDAAYQDIVSRLERLS